MNSPYKIKLLRGISYQGKFISDKEIRTAIQNLKTQSELTENNHVVFLGEVDPQKIISILYLVENNISFCWLSSKDSEAEIAKKINLIGESSTKSFPGANAVLNLHQPDNFSGKIIIFTSGTVGGPKGVALSLDNFGTAWMGLSKEVSFEEKDTWVLSLPCYHVSGISIILRAAFTGAALALPDKNSSAAIAKALQDYKCTHLSLVPAQLYELISSPSSLSHLKNLKLIMLGGFAMNESLKAKCLQADLNILLSYGMTEAAAALAVSRLSEEPGYRLLSHINATIDSNSEEQSGVVIIESAALADCYLDGQRIKPEFKSSDVGKIAKGRLQILGRMDRVINSGGVKIHPEEIEILVSQISGVIATAVIPIKDLKWGERPLLFLESEIDLDSNSIFDFLRKNLSDYKVPERIVKCKIPRLANGKINYSELSKNSAELLDTLS